MNDKETKEEIERAVREAISSYFNKTKEKSIKVKVHKAMDNEVDYITGEGFTEFMDNRYDDIWKDMEKFLKDSIKERLN